MNDEKHKSGEKQEDSMKKSDFIPDEQILWKRVKEKNVLNSDYSDSDFRFLLTTVIISLLLLIILSFFIDFHSAILILFVLVTCYVVISIYFMIVYLWDRFIKIRKFPLKKEELKQYIDYDIITESKLIQKKLHNFEIKLPRIWLKSHREFSNFNSHLYPNSIIKKKEDLLLLDLKKIKLIVSNRYLEKIYLFEKFKFQIEEYTIDNLKNVFCFEDAYRGVVSIDFDEREAQEKTKNILKERFHFKEKFENECGQIFIKKSNGSK